MNLLAVTDVSRKEKEIFSVKNISFTQQPFQKVAIAGETGSGKTSLLKMIAGLLQPDSGEIWFEQKKVRGPSDQLIPGHAGIAYLSQHFELRNNYWVHELLSYANELTQPAADALYNVCRIAHLLNRRTDELSGGEKQRIALARLLIGSPRLLLLDEPFSNLDAVHKRIIKSVVKDINAKLGISCILVSHDAADILSWADTILVMKCGRLVQQDAPEQIYRKPADEYCAGLFGEYNLFDMPEAVQLTASPGCLANGKRLFVRPEQLVMNAVHRGLEGRVQNILFMGAYYSVNIIAAGRQVKIKTGSITCKTGETVQLSVKDAAGWYI